MYGTIKILYTSLHDATALCKGVNHLLSLALTLAPENKANTRTEKEDDSITSIIK